MGSRLCGRKWEQETREEGAMMSRRETEAGPGWASGGGEEFRFWVDFVGGAHRVEPRQTRYGYERKKGVRKY